MCCPILSCSVMSDSLWLHGYSPPDSSVQGDSPAGRFFQSEPPGKSKNTEMGSLSLLQGIFPIHKLNQGLLYYRWVLLPAELPGKPIHLYQFSSVQFSCSIVSDTLQPHGLQHARLHCPSPTPRAYSNSRPSSQWCHPTISSSVTPFSSCPQSLLPSGSFPMSQLFTSGGQSIGVQLQHQPFQWLFRTDFL